MIPSEIFIIKIVGVDDLARKIIGIRPGAKIILHVKGESKVKKMIGFFKSLDENEIKPHDLSTSVFDSVHGRIEANLPLDLLMGRLIEEKCK